MPGPVRYRANSETSGRRIENLSAVLGQQSRQRLKLLLLRRLPGAPRPRQPIGPQPAPARARAPEQPAAAAATAATAAQSLRALRRGTGRRGRVLPRLRPPGGRPGGVRRMRRDAGGGGRILPFLRRPAAGCDGGSDRHGCAGTRTDGFTAVGSLSRRPARAGRQQSQSGGPAASPAGHSATSPGAEHREPEPFTAIPHRP
jgi:hypothetical protein